jgi:hypothetical protein
MDSFSPLSAARMLVQVLPIGSVTAELFEDTLKTLREAEAIRLEEIPPTAGADRGN